MKDILKKALIEIGEGPFDGEKEHHTLFRAINRARLALAQHEEQSEKPILTWHDGPSGSKEGRIGRFVWFRADSSFYEKSLWNLETLFDFPKTQGENQDPSFTTWDLMTEKAETITREILAEIA